MKTERIHHYLDQIQTFLVEVFSSPTFYTQLGAIAISLLVSYALFRATKKFFKITKMDSKESSKGLWIRLSKNADIYLMPLVLIITLSIAERLTQMAEHRSWLISIAQTITVLVLIHRMLTNLVRHRGKRKTAQIILMPLIVLFFMGWLDDISAFLETFKLSVGNITLTLNGLIKVSIFGILLFWMGKASNATGQSFIRNQKNLDFRSKELMAKLLEISIYILVFLLMLEIVGIDFTALAIFGGALGIGLGFGLQSIASNFISGIILLLDRSLSVGDHIELEDGQQGIVRVLNMRSATVETYDGKDVLVPNEKFITSTFINWTHQNTKQRYSIELQVAYDTDLHKLFDLLRETVASHPQVLSGDSFPIEEQPDAEIASFGDSGVNILIEYWMDGVDDGKNRVGADLLLMIWDAFKKHGIEIPFPQREVKILNEKS